MTTNLEVVELCAGAGGQALGLEVAGFAHKMAIELDSQAAATLAANRSTWDVRTGDVADPAVWDPATVEGVDLLAGGVPCPPFSIAGKQLGATDERDLFAWAVELAGQVKPKALLLENVRGLSAPRFDAYRQHVRDRLASLGYWSDWRLLQASDFGVPQLRPRFVLVALRHEFAAAFEWPTAAGGAPTVGQALYPIMSSAGWPGAADWARRANSIAPTIVGGSKKHGGADLGPTRAKRAWAAMGVDGLGVADAVPTAEHPRDFVPKLTTEMVAILQGWDDKKFRWSFTGRKTSRYRQIGNAFPPPVAAAVGDAISKALRVTDSALPLRIGDEVVHDEVYRVMRLAADFVSLTELRIALPAHFDERTILKKLDNLSRDFIIEESMMEGEPAFALRGFRGFVGQAEHPRHELFDRHRAKIS